MSILSSPLIVLSPVEALPSGVPNQPCGTLSNPKPGTLCYTVTPGGGKASAGGSRQEFSTIIQSTEPEYVIADVVVEVTSAAGERNGPTVSQISAGGVASVVSVATNKLRELRQIKGELQAKATVLSGPALIEAQAKLSALSEEERTFENVVTTTTAAGQDAGKFQVTGSASPRRCGTFNLDKCGSWIEYNIYVVRRYVGNPIAAYNRAFAVAQDAQNTINRLVANNSSSPAATVSKINFCNKTPNKDVYAVFSSFDSPNGWQSHGWYKVDSNQCKEVSIGRPYNGDVFIYGQADQGRTTWAGNDASFCINQKAAFTIPNSDQSCNGSDYKRVGMKKFSIRVGTNTWNFNP